LSHTKPLTMKLDIRPKNRWTLVGIEILLLCTLGIYWLHNKYHWDFFTGVIWWVVAFLLLSGLFFRIRLFRYLFTIAFSLIWGLMAYSFAQSASKSTTTHWVAAIVAILIALALHKDYFDFERGAN